VYDPRKLPKEIDREKPDSFDIFTNTPIPPVSCNCHKFKYYLIA
jgi:hypothetical protein